MSRYRKSYDILGVQSGDSWQQLRGAYKRAIRRWHPDRYAHSEIERTTAEEKTKAINSAYRELEEYYRYYGQLPFDADLAERAPSAETRNDPPPSPGASSSAARQPSPSGPAAGPLARRSRRASVAWMLVAAFLLGYILVVANIDDPTSPAPAETSSDLRPPETPQQGIQPAEHRPFTFGSSVGEVYSAQGIPTRIEGDVWYYGDARVFFRNGKVVQWIDAPGHALAAQISPAPPVPVKPQWFSRGSTKDEVRAIQGAPLHESYGVWDYGTSHVYFSGDKVIGWDESALDPLRARR